MGTNYYWEPKDPCEHYGRAYDRVHIGKSSGGWCFSLHVKDPRYEWDETPVDLEDWKSKWATGRIVDDCGRVETPEEMLGIITQRSWSHIEGSVPYGYRNWAHFHRSNQSAPGPNNLCRHMVDGTHCIGHGAGTWDLIAGEFS